MFEITTRHNSQFCLPALFLCPTNLSAVFSLAGVGERAQESSQARFECAVLEVLPLPWRTPMHHKAHASQSPCLTTSARTVRCACFRLAKLAAGQLDDYGVPFERGGSLTQSAVNRNAGGIVIQQQAIHSRCRVLYTGMPGVARKVGIRT